MMCILENPKRLANLLASINVPGNSRPLLPTEVAREIQALLKELGGDQKELARRLPISNEFIREFLWLLKLTPKYQDAVMWGESDVGTGRLGFSVAAKIARLDKHQDQEKLASEILSMSRPATKEEIKEILSLKRQNSKKDMSECLLEVLNVTRTVTVKHFMFVSGLKKSFEDKLNNKSLEHSRDNVAFDVLDPIFPTGVLKNARVLKGCIRLSMSERGPEFITEYSQRYGLLRQNVINHMLESVGLGNGKR